MTKQNTLKRKPNKSSIPILVNICELAAEQEFKEHHDAWKLDVNGKIEPKNALGLGK